MFTSKKISNRLLKYENQIKSKNSLVTDKKYFRVKRYIDSESVESSETITSTTLKPKFVNRQHYNLLDNKSRLGPLGVVASTINKMLLASKNKTHLEE